MDPFEVKAREVFDRLAPSQSFEAAATGDHPFLDFITQLLQQLAPLLINCLPKAQRGDPSAFHNAITQPNFRQRAGLRFRVRQSIDDPRTGNVGSRELEDAIVASFASTTPEQSKTMVAMCA